MSGLTRYTAILRLFGETRGALTVADMAEALRAPPSTVYRTVRDLVREGFLEPATDAHYRLGAAFIEFDRLLRKSDPFLEAGGAFLPDLVAAAGVPCRALLARLYNDTVMCVADCPSALDAPSSSYERGRPMPLVRGASSRVILAHLPARRLGRLFASAPVEPFPREEEAFRAELKAIRKRGHTLGRSEIDPQTLGIAAPVLVPEAGIVGSLGLVLQACDVDAARERRLAELLVAEAGRLAERLRSGPRGPSTAPPSGPFP